MKLKRLHLSNFKCYKDLDIEFGKVTLLTGANSSGKSSILYSILGAMQSSQFPFSFSPNGKYVRMGDYDDIVHNHDEDLTFGIELYPEEDIQRITTEWEIDKNSKLPALKELYVLSDHYEIHVTKVRKYHLTFSYDVDKDPDHKIFQSKVFQNLIKSLNSIADEGDQDKDRQKRLKSFEEILLRGKDSTKLTFSKVEDLKQLISDVESYPLHKIYNDLLALTSKHNVDFNYISSFRNLPERTYYERAQADLKIGRYGENYQDQLISWEMNGSSEMKELLKIMRELSLFQDIKTRRMGGGRFEILVRIGKKGIYASLNDVGFGISQFIPIIIADLQLSENSVLLIAQPEIHLHPSVQAQFADYIVKQVKEKGKRYIIETHSEYLINRLRLAIVKSEIEEEDVRTYFITNNGIEAKKQELLLTKSGKIEGAPKEFFDTYMLDVMNIALNS